MLLFHFEVSTFRAGDASAHFPNNTFALESCDFRPELRESYNFGAHGNALRTLSFETYRQRTLRTNCVLKLANFKLELQGRTSCTTFALKSCDSRLSSWSCGSALLVSLLYLETAILQPELSGSLRVLLLYVKLASFQSRS